MSKTRVALIGAGGMANGVHYPSLAGFDDVEMVAICDLMPDKLKETAEKFSIDKTYDDYRKMIEETSPDAVYALMPPHHVFDLAMDTMQAGHALFIEKPPGVTTFQTQAMARFAEQKQLVTGVGFQRRYHPMVHRCYDMVREKNEPSQVTVSFHKFATVGDPYPYYRGAIDLFRCDAIHAVDSVRYYCGLSDVKSVSSVVRKLDSTHETSFNALIHFANDCVGILQTNWRAGHRFFTFEMHAAGASAYASIDGRAEVWQDGVAEPKLSTTFDTFAGTDQMHVHQGFEAQARAFIDAVQQKVPPHNSFHDAVKTMELADRVLSERQ